MDILSFAIGFVVCFAVAMIEQTIRNTKRSKDIHSIEERLAEHQRLIVAMERVRKADLRQINAKQAQLAQVIGAK